MNIGLLITGRPPESLEREFGGYDVMIARLLGPQHVYQVYHLANGVRPGSSHDHDAWVVSGSPSGVHDDDPWIGELEDFVRTASRDVPFVGICFGHQLIAKALGARVERAPQGWGAGLHRYDVIDRPLWLDEGDVLTLPAWHRDQVMTLPSGGRILARSAFTPFAMLGYDDRSVISVQAHPEFSASYARSLIRHHRGGRIGAGAADAALETITEDHAGATLGRCIDRWLTACMTTTQRRLA